MIAATTAAATAAVLGVTSLLLFAFGLNLLHLTIAALRLPPPRCPAVVEGQEPRVCVQVPVYNERYVAERVIDAVCALDWPRSRLEVQVLDDSDDETRAIVAASVAGWQGRGCRITHVRRDTRNGFKAGALAHGLALTNAPLVAVFDADFVPPPDFLRRTVGAFSRAEVGFVQARWGHLNERYSWFTRLQAMAIDFHFLVEQPARTARGYFTNFTGTAGAWRRAAIEDAGGWTADTLTEDLDLSYRAQLRGWKPAYVEAAVVPEELPVSLDAYRRQQSRWATGSFQSARKLLFPLLRSHHRPVVKLQGAIHLLSYGVGPLMLLQLVMYPALLITLRRGAAPWPLSYALLLLVPVTVAPWFGFAAAQTRAQRRWWSGAPALICQVIGSGMALTSLLALLRALRPGGDFVRTPKHRIERTDQEWRGHAYVRAGDPQAIAEGLAGCAALAIAVAAASQRQWLVAVYATMFALGFLSLAALTAAEVLSVIAMRRARVSLGVHARRRAPQAGLLALCALLLLAAAQVPEPFEDGYAHWLIAANLAATGHLRDPLFGMEDTWLPGYHLLAAALLRLVGLWRLDALKALSALLGLATLACVYRLAGERRRGLLAVALLALNPVFLFTSGSAVAEPLLTALIAAAALLASRGALRSAALLAALACATSTKAWVWVAATIAVLALERLMALERLGRRRGWGRRARIGWLAPAVAVLVLLQLAFAPASHSVARASVEAASAASRGSTPHLGLARALELGQTFGLAALPLLALAAVGTWRLARDPAGGREKAAMLYLGLPALFYLASVFALVGAGAYTGSHRYLYPALPGLALLAARAAARFPAPAGTLAVAASALSAVAFLPVFTSFGSLNLGLEAAGRTAGAGPGVLLTDSPVAAFYSGRPPELVTGSRDLPADPGQALAWMRDRGVNDLVVEDISYYRATAVFPELARGMAVRPFTAIGRAPQAPPGAKRAYAYAFDTAGRQALRPGLELGLPSGPAPGRTAPLAKGMVITARGRQAAGEGVGFGVPIVHYPDGWVYSRTAATEHLWEPTGGAWRRVFNMDEVGGDAAHGYAFDAIPSRGLIEVTYRVDQSGVRISVRVLQLAPGFSEIGILNEESAAFDDFADASRTLLGDRFGSWVPVTGDWGRLRSAALATEYSAPVIAGAELHAGRELKPPDFDWAGLDYTFPAPFSGTDYHLNIQEAR